MAKSNAAVAAVPFSELEKRQIPEAVTLSGDTVMAILNALRGAENVLEFLAGYAPASGSLLGNLAHYVELEAFGEIPGDGDDAYGDEPWLTDPIIVENWAASEEVEAAILEAMAKENEWHLSPDALLKRASERRTDAAVMRAAGTIDNPYTKAMVAA